MDKNRFTFLRSYWEAINGMTDAEAGRLIKGLCSYVFDDQEPSFKDKIVKISWMLIRPNLDTNIKKIYGGYKGGKPKENSKDGQP